MPTSTIVRGGLVLTVLFPPELHTLFAGLLGIIALILRMLHRSRLDVSSNSLCGPEILRICLKARWKRCPEIVARPWDIISGPQKGPAERGRQKTSKIVQKCQKYFRHFSTSFAQGKTRQKVFKSFSTLFDNFRAAPVFRPLFLGGGGGSDIMSQTNNVTNTKQSAKQTLGGVLPTKMSWKVLMISGVARANQAEKTRFANWRGSVSASQSFSIPLSSSISQSLSRSVIVYISLYFCICACLL